MEWHKPEIHEIHYAEGKLSGQGGLSASAAQLLGAAAALVGQAGMHIDETGKNIGGFKWHSLTYPGGRPSSRGRVREEALRRLRRGQFPETLKEFGEQLSRWLKELEQTIIEEVPQMTPPVVERNINDLWNEWHRCRGCKPAPW
jgi:hypothetical protein